MLRIFGILSILCASSHAVAQQDAMFTQYMFNPLLINPAYAGSQDNLNLTALSRVQWTGIEGAPITHTLSGHSLLKNKINAVGGNIVYDQLGVTKQTSVLGVFSHRIFLKKATLSMGLQAGFTSINSRLSTLNVKNNEDDVFTSNDISGFMPNFGFGLFYYAERYYLGLSTPRFVNNLLKRSVAISDARQQRHYFLAGGYVFPLSDNLELKPNFLVKMVEGAPIQVDLNANILIKKLIWLGVSYRSFESVDLIAELNVKPNIRIGYSYDIGINALRQFNSGSHELMINYEFSKEKEKVNAKPYTPRYF